MDLGARVTLGVFSALFGIVMLLIVPDVGPTAGHYVFGGFCLCLALACLTQGWTAKVFGSTVACCVVIAGLGYLAWAVAKGPVFSDRQGLPSVVNAILFNVVFSLPAGLYVWKVRFGWRKDLD